MNFKTYSGNNILRKIDSAYFDVWDTFLNISFRMPNHKEKSSNLSDYFDTQRQIVMDRFTNGMFRDKTSKEIILSDLQRGIEELTAVGLSLDLVPLLERVQHDVKKVPFQAAQDA